MKAVLTDHRFWIGAAVGWLVIPAVSRFASMQLAKRSTPTVAAGQ
jgi:hypothetical protein